MFNMARPRRTIPCIHPRRTGSLSVSISEISQTPPSSPEPFHYGIQRVAATAQPKRVSKAKAGKRRPATRSTMATGCWSESLPANLDNVNNEYNALSDHGSLSSIAEMMESGPEQDESRFQKNTGFSQSQRAAIEAIVTDSVRS